MEKEMNHKELREYFIEHYKRANPEASEDDIERAYWMWTCFDPIGSRLDLKAYTVQFKRDVEKAKKKGGRPLE
ncbi:MAG: hypothetical protein LBQ97_05000 [Fusobacteriaceae bacterium]|nr:hypothetical protein [Fusobacteriaceae bacterium]